MTTIALPAAAVLFLGLAIYGAGSLLRPADGTHLERWLWGLAGWVLTLFALASLVVGYLVYQRLVAKSFAAGFFGAGLSAVFAAGFVCSLAAGFFAAAFLAGFFPSVRISVIRKTVTCWRWPLVRR